MYVLLQQRKLILRNVSCLLTSCDVKLGGIISEEIFIMAWKGEEFGNLSQPHICTDDKVLDSGFLET